MGSVYREDLEQAITSTVGAADRALDALDVEEQSNAALSQEVGELTQKNQSLTTQLGTKQSQLDQANARIAELEAEALVLQAEIDELKGTVTPPPPDPEPIPPTVVKEFIPAGALGGGGMNGIVVAPNGDRFMITDVGGVVHAEAGKTAFHKCNWNLADRHTASITVSQGKILVHTGAPGTQKGGQFFDMANHKWGPVIPGSNAIKVNSQNSFGDPNSTSPSAWKFGIGNRYVRSTGQLTYVDPAGTLWGGQFGFGGQGGVTYVTNGSATTVPGTGKFSVRDLRPLDKDTALACVWKGGTIIDSPGGLYKVTKAGATKILDGQVEQTSVLGSVIVAAVRGVGIKKSTDGGSSWTDISGNLPKNQWWRCVSIKADGSIQASACDANGGNDMALVPINGKYWSWAVLGPNASTWTNLTDKMDNKDLTTGVPFVPPNSSNVFGGKGCTVIDVDWAPDGKAWSAGGGGIALRWDGTVVRPAAFGVGITVNRDVAASADGRTVALAMMDHRVQLSYDGGTTFDKVGGGLSGSNDGNVVGFAADGTLHLQLDDGSKWKLPSGAKTWTTSTVDPGPLNPHSTRVVWQGSSVKLDGKEIANGALDEFGVNDIKEVNLVGGWVWAIGHGAIRYKV